MNYFIDSHAHIYLDDFNSRIENIIDNSINNNIEKILMPNINLKTVQSMFDISKRYKKTCFSMLGLHPCYVNNDYENEIAEIFNHFNSEIIAIGEIGLDFYKSDNNHDNQTKAFEIQCELAIEKKLPVVMRSL